MTEQRLYRRLVRRSMFRSRSTAVVLALSVLALIAAYVGVECVLAALGQRPLLIAPADALAALEVPGTIVLAVAGGLAALGVLMLIAALAPGRRGRHELADARMAVVVDDAILAGAIGRVATREAGVPASRVSTVVSRRRASVHVTGTSGSPLDAPTLETAAHGLVATLETRPALRVSVQIAAHSVVGA